MDKQCKTSYDTNHHKIQYKMLPEHIQWNKHRSKIDDIKIKYTKQGYNLSNQTHFHHPNRPQGKLQGCTSCDTPDIADSQLF